MLYPRGTTTWATRSKVKADILFALPEGVDPQQLSMLMVNPPTAYLLLTEYVPLKKGGWVLQTAGNSAVGRAVIAIARQMGRSYGKRGAPARTGRRTEKAWRGRRTCRRTRSAQACCGSHRQSQDHALALDCVGGPGLMAVNESLANGGTLVAYGVMSGGPGRFSSPRRISSAISR